MICFVTFELIDSIYNFLARLITSLPQLCYSLALNINYKSIEHFSVYLVIPGDFIKIISVD